MIIQAFLKMMTKKTLMIEKKTQMKKFLQRIMELKKSKKIRISNQNLNKKNNRIRLIQRVINYH